MKDTSIFKGIRIFGDFILEDNGSTWKAYHFQNYSWVFFAHMSKIDNESNRDLYDRTSELYYNDDEDHDD